MAKNQFLDWDQTASNNTDIGGIGILGTNAVSNFDDAFRTAMAQLRAGVDGEVVYAAKSGNYTAVANDNNAYLRFTAAATLSLTAVATLAANWHIFVQADGGDVTVDPNASETINGATTIVIRNGESALIVSSGTAFFAKINSIPVAYASKSGNYTALNSDNNAVHRYTAAATASLTAAATLGTGWNYTIVANGAAVTIDPNGSETINGLTTITVPDGTTAKIVCDGSNFFTVIKPMPWEVAGPSYDLAGLSNVAWTNTSGYRDLRLRVFGIPSGTTGNLFLRVSSDNGSTYDSGASDYSHAFINAESTALAAVAGVTAAQFNLMNVNIDTNPFEFNVTLAEWNKAAVSLIDSKGFAFNSTGSVQRNTNAYGRRLASTAFNALQFGISAGTFSRGMAIIEGVRG